MLTKTKIALILLILDAIWWVILFAINDWDWQKVWYENDDEPLDNKH